MAARDTRRAQNQKLFRLGNERLDEVIDGRVPKEAKVPFLCECADESCTGRVELERSQWGSVAAKPNHFVMVAGHPRSEGESSSETLTNTTWSASLTDRMGSTEGDQRADRAARNEALFRRVNERIEEVNEAFASITEHGEFVCECADAACAERIQLTLSAYEAVRSVPTRFVVKPGHVLPDSERIVEEHSEYFVVEKVGRAGERARQLDERSDRRESPAAEILEQGRFGGTPTAHTIARSFCDSLVQWKSIQASSPESYGASRSLSKRTLAS